MMCRTSTPQPDIANIGVLARLSCKGVLPVGRFAEGHVGAVRNLDELLDWALAGVTSVGRHD